jgi:two-component system CAI-1 autoinducer sensor kinase/phosphatase CqsS
MKFIGSTLDTVASRLFEPALRNLEYFQRRLRVFAIIAIVAFPAYYIVWHFLFPQPYENLAMRLFGAALFVPILYSSRWPEHWKRFLPHYWYISLLYSLPFFFTYMLLKNNGTDIWIGSALVAVFVMILLLDWITLIAHFVLGVGLALVAYAATNDFSLLSFNYHEYIAIAIFAVVIGAVSNYDSERIRIEQERAMLATAGSIAHELRTPLISIRSGAAGLNKYLPTLLDAYQQARAHQLPVASIRTAHLDALKGVLDRIDLEVYHSNAVIDMLLVNVRLSGDNSHELTLCSMNRCIELALERYPFSEEERTLMSWQPGTDFQFKGVELLAVHVLFNLIKNALRHISKARKGDIQISLASRPEANQLIFRDTGGGIPPDVLSHVFVRFYTSSNNTDSILGTGIGLAFCRDVMQAFGGSIECRSVFGEFSEFILTFPKP